MKEEAALARTVIKKRLAGQPAPDIWFLIILMLLVCYGLVMLFSAGYAVALYRRGDAYTYIRPQLLFAAFGAAAMYAASLVDYHIWHKLAWPIMGVSLALLAIVLFMPEYNGCKRWIVLPGLGTLQPSEIAKFAVVLVFAHIISLNHDRMQTFATGVLPFMVILGAVTVLMLLEPRDTDGPTVREDEHIPTMRSEDMVNARSLKNGEFMNSIYLPGKVLSILSENKEVAPNVSMAIPKSCVLTDLATGKSEEYVTSFINDFLMCPGTFSFRNGYLIQSFSALEFMEIGRNALDLGLLHGKAADQVASILADLEETDNDILMLARLRQ